MKKCTKQITASVTAVAAVPIIAVGAELALHPPCEFKSGCRATANSIGYTAIKSKQIFESFNIYTEYSESELYNTTHTNIGQAALTRLVSYYETAFARPKSSHLAVPLNPSHRPTDVPYVVGLRPATDHKMLIVDSNTVMPDGLLNNGVTSFEGSIAPDQTITVVRDDSKEGYSALDILGTEVCQAVVEVSSKSSNLARQLGQETFCNSEGVAVKLAREGLPYAAYRQNELSQGGGYVPYEGQQYELNPIIVSASTYSGMLQAFQA